MRIHIEECKQKGTTVWGHYLDSMGFHPSSPIRPYIAATLHRQLRPKMCALFQGLGGKLTLKDLMDISENLTGTVHVLNNVNSETTLAPVEEKEKRWFCKFGPGILPAEDLDNFDVFQAWMELLLVRRVMKTLLYSIASKPWFKRLELLRQGLARNIVVNISLSIKDRSGKPISLRFHTITPKSSTGMCRIEE